MNYSDFVAFFIIFVLVPSIIVKASVNLLPLALAVICAKRKKKKLSNFFLKVSRKYSDFHNSVERGIAHGLSCLLHPVRSFKNYRKNKKIISFLRKNVKKGDPVMWENLPTNMEFAIQKEGSWEVFFQMLSMFSVLPTIRHAAINNPFLYEYKMHITNQYSESFTDQEKMCKILFSYVNDPAFIFKYDIEKRIDHIQFSPNYYNEVGDHIIDYNQIGLQISTYFSTLIFLDTLNKSGKGLLSDVVDQNYDKSLMHRDHPIYSTLKQYDLDLWNKVQFDDANRVMLLDLVVPYDHHYHLVTGKIEANITDDNRIEHPMFCLYNNGYVTRKFWDAINELFQNNVMEYLKSLELS